MIEKGMKSSRIFNCIVSIFLVCLSSALCAQHGTVKGKVILSAKPIKGAFITLIPSGKITHSNEDGEFVFKKVQYGICTVKVEFLGAAVYLQNFTLSSDIQTLDIALAEDTNALAEVIVRAKDAEGLGATELKAVDGFGIYEAKKSEVVVMKDMTMNASTNNARQVFSKITGLNIWESDRAGLQMGVGGRGLSPNRTANFNTRQNGYDISADALGYPESYYTPPLEGLRRIEIVRGAAALQYGTQFGGMLNFEMNDGPKDKKIELVSRQTFGSWNYFGSFNAIGGTVAKNKLNYYAFYQRKQGNGWRPNGGFESNTAYISLTYAATPRLKVNVDYTFMDYLAQQPGGLTDAEFNKDPQQSIRSRNWFKVIWNLMAVTADYRFTENTKLNTRTFGLVASRQSVGILSRINVIDQGGPRDLIDGRFQNIGNETRLIHHYKIGKTEETLLVGFRIYNGKTRNRQGIGASGSDPNFTYPNPDNLEGSDYTFPNWNAALFAEQIFSLTPKFSITPGLRYEYIKTSSYGYYSQIVKDNAGNIISQQQIENEQVSPRGFLLGGVGLSYKATDQMEFYANISQNYRAINFSDLYINNPSVVVDPNMKDEKGFTADLGIRGRIKNAFRYELTGFYIYQKGRIGVRQKAGGPPTFQDYRYRTNIADAKNIGIEAFAELDVWKLLKPEVQNRGFSFFGNIGYVNAVYFNTEDKAINGKRVEQASPLIFRAGTTFHYKNFRLSYQYSYTQEHYTDATNAVKSTTAVIGIIPTYVVMDLSASYTWKYFTLEASVNNLADARYFTRRAESYPGPGIIPSDARSYFLTLQVKL